MRNLFFLLFSIVSITGCSQKTPSPSSTQQKPEVRLVAPKEFATEMEARKGVLLDVRTPGEYKKGHLKNARLLDLFSDNFLDEINKLDTTQTYFVYCAIGGRSAEVCELMQQKGFQLVFDMDGGFNKWKQDGLPYE
jgi:rhodanese-related sulfurtransferase